MCFLHQRGPNRWSDHSNKIWTFLCSSLMACLFITVSSSVMAYGSGKTIQFSFDSGSMDWRGDFTDYPVNEDAFYQLAWGWENVPQGQDGLQRQDLFQKGIYLSGNNHSDDLFMFIKTPITGLQPDTLYSVVVTVNFASNVPPGLSGIGGSPGESVAFKVGASTEEPQKIKRGMSYFLNVDKGNQFQGGVNAVVVGNLANPLVDVDNPVYKQKQVSNASHPLLVRTDNTGRLWIFTGTDSGFEGTSKYYIGNVSVSLQPRPAAS